MTDAPRDGREPAAIALATTDERFVTAGPQRGVRRTPSIDETK